MVLSSQTARADRGRRNKLSRRRRRSFSPGPWLLLGTIVLLIGGCFWVFSGGGDDPVEGAGGADPVDVAGGTTPTSSPDPDPVEVPGPAPAPVDQPEPRPPTPDPQPTPDPDPVDPLSDRNVESARQLRAGLALIEQGKPVEARRLLSELLTLGEYDLAAGDAQRIRATLTRLNEQLIFSPRVYRNDPLVAVYEVNQGDYLSRVAPQFDIPYQLIERVNKVDARRIRIGQELKVIRGPFHAVVDKSAYRMDLYLKDKDEQPIYIRSLPVGLGAEDSTPAGRWVVRPGSKLENPGWRHPRTGKVWDKDDPDIPIGEYWLGLKGVGEHTEGLKGYGIHGTNDPASIGQQASLGCIRLKDEDIKLVFD
ncbi:MAG: L,D-transpeptidase family protein, partial [Phycisphaeraceae bacterium]|nr:L,D-transpeptidase family protein [Phycisphaeraceae bacterium]